MSNEVLDARRLLCPLPVIRTQNLVKTLASGTRLTIICTDPGAARDVPAWCRVHGHHLVSIEHIHKEIHIVLEVK